MQANPASNATSRRNFLSASAVGATAIASLSSSLSAGVFASGSDRLKVGLIGCGGRGSGAAEQALNADPGTEIVALGDIFADAIVGPRRSLTRQFNKDGAAPRVTVTDDTCYSGFDNYLRVIEKSDVVLLATTPHFRPQHLRAAVEAGKHVFCEKPVAVDAPGVRSVMESSEMAAAKGLALVSGLC